MQRPARFRTALALAAAAGVTLAGCASPEAGGGGTAEEGAEVPDRVSLVIPYDPGGGTDLWARFMAPYLNKTVEGSPSFSPENRPGGESITGSNQFVSSGGTDGSELLVTSGTTYFQYLLGREEVQFDFTKMRPLILNGTGGVIYVSSETGIDGVEDLADPPSDLVYGGISATGLDLSTLLAFDLLDLDVDATFGFEGRGPARLALERGEINVDYQTTTAYNSEVVPMIEDGTAVPLMSFGEIDENGDVVRDPNLPDLPTVEEVYEELNGEAPSGPEYEAYRAFLAAGYPYQKGLWANEDTPDSVVEAFWEAADELSEDEEFNEKGEAVLGGYPIYSGGEVGDEVAESFEISDEARGYVLDLLAEEYDTDLR